MKKQKKKEQTKKLCTQKVNDSIRTSHPRSPPSNTCYTVETDPFSQTCVNHVVTDVDIHAVWLSLHAVCTLDSKEFFTKPSIPSQDLSSLDRVVWLQLLTFVATPLKFQTTLLWLSSGIHCSLLAEHYLVIVLSRTQAMYQHSVPS